MDRTIVMEALIKFKSGHYDMALITRLNLSSLSITSSVGIEHCINLIELNLSHNNIIDVLHVNQLKKLETLNLSYNKIRTLHSFELMSSTLERLFLEGNEIESIEEISKLHGMDRLRMISFQTKDKNNQNPICCHPKYETELLSLGKSIQIFDYECVQWKFMIKDIIHTSNKSENNSPDQFTLSPWSESENMPSLKCYDMDSCTEKLEFRTKHVSQLHEDLKEQFQQSEKLLESSKIKQK